MKQQVFGEVVGEQTGFEASVGEVYVVTSDLEASGGEVSVVLSSDLWA